MSNKWLIVIEIIWIVTGILCVIAGIRFALTNGGNKIFVFALMALVSFTFAWFRHNQRKKN
jgi:hypothetical protein